MRPSLFILIATLILSCNHAVKRGNRLELSQDIERLNKSSRAVVNDWKGYCDLENNLKLLSNTNPLNALAYKEVLKDNICSMQKEIPAALDNGAINRKVRLIEKRVSSFCSDIEDDELHKEAVNDHITEILFAFESLNMTINQTVSEI